MNEANAKIEERMDSFDKRLTTLETKFDSMRGEVKEDLCDIKARLNDIYQEKVAWSEWSRMALSKIGVWLAKWGTVIIFTAIGVGNAEKISKLFTV